MGGSREEVAAAAVGVPRLLGRFFLRTITRMMWQIYIYLFMYIFCERGGVRVCVCLSATGIYLRKVFLTNNKFEVSPWSLVSLSIFQVMAVHKRISTPRDIEVGLRYSFRIWIRMRIQMRIRMRSVLWVVGSW